MRPPTPVLALALASALAGCFGNDAGPTSLTLSASGGKVSEGWAYDGAGLVPSGATLTGTLDDAGNTGNVTATFDFHAGKYVVVFDRFNETKDFMGGGVRFGFDEHGESKNGDASLPMVHAKAAGWGFARLTRDGAPLVGKAGDLWTAHIMVLDDSPRGADGKILSAAGTAPYDPAKPGDAKVARGDPQVMMYVKSPDGETAMRAPLNVTKDLAFAGPPSSQSVDIASEKGAESLVVNVAITGAAGPVPGVGNATITLRDAGGNATKKADLTLLPNAPASATFTLSEKEITGAYKLVIDGAGAFNAKVEAVVVFDDHPFLVITWDDVTVS
jgi:hypothetical protein